MKTLLARVTQWIHVPAWIHAPATRWYEISLVNKHEVTCSCGGHLIDRPGEFDFTITKGACSHIVALYTGNVTTDKHKIPATAAGYQSPVPVPHYVQLTTAGTTMFRWRWVALALDE